jgi:nitrate/nitrite-specific signal transduction histidine kinase
MIMRERAAAIGAELRVESAPGHGTRVFVTVREPASSASIPAPPESGGLCIT